MCIFICMFIYTNVYTPNTHLKNSLEHRSWWLCLLIYISLYFSLSLSIYIYIHLHIYVFIYIYVNIFTYMYIYMHVGFTRTRYICTP